MKREIVGGNPNDSALNRKVMNCKKNQITQQIQTNERWRNYGLLVTMNKRGGLSASTHFLWFSPRVITSTVVCSASQPASQRLGAKFVIKTYVACFFWHFFFSHNLQQKPLWFPLSRRSPISSAPPLPLLSSAFLLSSELFHLSLSQNQSVSGFVLFLADSQAEPLRQRQGSMCLGVGWGWR